MAIEGKLTRFLNKRNWIIPLLFVSMIVFLVLAIAAYETRKYSVELGHLQHLRPDFAFSIGGEIAAMFVAIIMTFSILPSYKRHSGYIRIFVTVLAAGCLCIFLDILQMLADSIPAFASLNKVLCILVFMSEAVFFFFFYLYATYALQCNGKVTKVVNSIMYVALAAFMILPLVNFFYPIYFTIKDGGEYSRNPATWWLCRVLFGLMVGGIITAIITSKERKGSKVIVLLYVALPVLSIAAGGFFYGVSILYTAMIVALVLIYSFIFSDHERHLYSTNKELGLATNIQNGMLPSIFPAFPDRKEFDIYASMKPAKEVGGDFYDFFLIDDDHLGLVIADVSDKGVPAALFMMASKIMVQNYAMLNISPKEVLTKVNKQICSNNQTEMFVTVWLGILDLKTGILTASNAGHEKPMIKKPDGHFEMINDVHGFVVGWNKDAIYKDYKIKLEKGSKLFVYTDGVPEATNEYGKFGRDKTVEALRKYEDKSPNEILRGMNEEVEKFMGKSDQFDDITMLCVEYLGSDEKTKNLSYTHKARVEDIDKMIDPILASLKEIDVDSKVSYKIRLALDEVLTNVCSYAYAPETGEVSIKSQISTNPKSITLTIIDEGKEFNPLEAREPDLDASVEDRKIGGLGIFIAKNIMDDISYKREDNKNILTMKKTF